MPTLKEYQARGIDVTLMTSEQLIAEGYVTPMNELPIIIDGPGDYRTRNGRRITIHKVAPTATLATTACNAKGSVWKSQTKLGANPEYSIWHISGRYSLCNEHKLDIVERWDCQKDRPIKMEKIGVLDAPDGRDEYVLLTGTGDNFLTPEEAQAWLLPKVYKYTDNPGDYYCMTVRAVQAQYSTNKVICTIEHRYNI